MTLQQQIMSECCLNCRYFWVEECARAIGPPEQYRCSYYDDARQANATAPTEDHSVTIQQAIESLGYTQNEPPISRRKFTNGQGTVVFLCDNFVLCGNNVRVCYDVDWSRAPKNENSSEWRYFFHAKPQLDSVRIFVDGEYTPELRAWIEIAAQIATEYNRLKKESSK